MLDLAVLFGRTSDTHLTRSDADGLTIAGKDATLTAIERAVCSGELPPVSKVIFKCSIVSKVICIVRVRARVESG